MATISTINNGIPGLSFRTQVNDNFTALNLENVTQASSITAVEDRATALEAGDNIISIVTTSALAAQTLVAGVPEKLEWMTTALVDAGNSSISYDIPTDNILILEAGVYKVYGVVSMTAPINDIVDVELYVDNLPTGFSSSCIGRGDTSKVTFVYSFLTNFAINDDINLYITSTGTSATVESASVTVEKTIH